VPPFLSGSSDAGADAYARAGVDLAARNAYVEELKRITRTSRPEVLSEVGMFAALWRLAGYRDPVLAASTDGVGTKIRIAQIMGRYDTIGQDLVNHCVNDILTTGAEPLFMLDYIGTSDLPMEQKVDVVAGMKQACTAAGCELVGGETADMPDIYGSGDFDLVGFIVGVVEREDVISPARVQAGDALLALPSNGLQTNGYSLVRRIFGIGVGGDAAADRAALDTYHEELGATLGEALLAIHPPYLAALRPVLKRLHGVAHITGGGIIDNVPRMLPEGLAARLDAGSWNVLPIFRLIQERGDISDFDMYHTFNMGLGMVIAVDPREADAIMAAMPGAMRVGVVERQRDERRVIVA